ncbi:hypothetical protein ASC87_08080 [Rhizobacter sp. Root1221]|nr:hypothetical protein ASC87_08080 [Rhizobacter sp. Root1221]
MSDSAGLKALGLQRSRTAFAKLERHSGPTLTPEPLPPLALLASTPHGAVSGARPFVQATARASLFGLTVPEETRHHVPSAVTVSRLRPATGSAASSITAERLNTWLARRPPLESDVMLADGSRIHRYSATDDQAGSARSEAFYTATPGLAAAILTIHPEAEARAGTAPSAAQIAEQLTAPPLGLLTGVWPLSGGTSLHLHNNRLHVFSGAGAGVDAPGQWQAISIAPVAAQRERLQMLGQQGDGEVYGRAGPHLLRLRAETVDILELPGVGAEDVVRVGPDKVAHALQEGQLRRIGNGAAAVPEVPRPIALSRWNGAGGLEPSPSRPVDFLVHGQAANQGLIVLDQRGRLYEAPMSGDGPIEARRLPLPASMLPAEDWTVTDFGLAQDGSLQALCEHKAGGRVSLQRSPGAESLQPAFRIDQPLLLVAREGLHAPESEQMDNRIQYDGHAEFGSHQGIAHYRASPDHPWTELLDAAGKPVSDVIRLASGPFGFIDRKPLYALLADPPAIVALKLQGRTTVLPALDAGAAVAGGPLAVVPARVEATTEPLFHLTVPAGEVRAFTVDKEGHVYVLDVQGHLSTNRPAPASAADVSPGSAPLPGRIDAGLLSPLGIALGGDNRLHALDRQPDGHVLLKRLSAEQVWEEVPIDLSTVAGAKPQELRMSRTGQIELRLEQHGWHAVLPAMTDPRTGGLLPSRVDPNPVDPPRATEGINAGTNTSIDHQGPTRVRLPLPTAPQSANHNMVTTTALLGNTSTDPLSWTSNAKTLARNTRSHLGALASAAGDVFLDSARATGNALGFTAMRASQYERLKGHFHAADQAHQALGALLADGGDSLARHAGSARSPADLPLPPQDQAQLVALREQTLQRLLADLRKIGFEERALDPTFAAKKDTFSATTVTYKAAETVRSAGRRLQEGLSDLTGRSNDLLPVLADAFSRIDPSEQQSPGLSPLERGMVEEIHRTLAQLGEAGVRLATRPAPAASADEATRDRRDNQAIRTASISHLLVTYDQLLQAAGPDDVAAAQARIEGPGPHRLSHLGLSSWIDLEAFDEVASTFRDDMSTPHSARRQQLLKSMGLPADAAPDQMAARMSALLQDLYNRSTFFSTRIDGIALGGRAGHTDWEDWSALPMSAGGEAIHALGVERIGDSKDGDAGLVAFFVRHARGSGSVSAGPNFDLKPGKGVGEHLHPSHSVRQAVKASWNANATIVRMSASVQHGVGAAVLLSPETIPEFARLLFDAGDSDTTKLLARGWNEGAIGLDLFETNLNYLTDIGAAANAVDLSRTYGKDDKSSVGFSVGGTLRASLNAHASEMELHLDHAWNEILGLEFQGSIDFRASANAQIRAGGFMATAWDLLSSSSGLGNLQVAAINASVSDANLPLDQAARAATGVWNTVTGRRDEAPVLGTSTYKRTLDAQAGRSITPGEWTSALTRLREASSDAAAELGDAAMPALPSERIAFLDRAIARLQGNAATAIEARGAFEGSALVRQREDARIATRSGADALWHVRSSVARTRLVDSLKGLKQQELSAREHRARLVPGARVELNLLGRESLDLLVTRALGHTGLGGKLAEAHAIKDQIPGLADVMARFKGIDNINQVRFVFEMRPQALAAINDALALKEQQDALRVDRTASIADEEAPAPALDNDGVQLDWREVLELARYSPDLYRLAVIAPHNTDDNPSIASVGLLGVTHTTSASASHQLFQAEVQFLYGMHDELAGVEVLEGGARALDKAFQPLRRAGVAPVALSSPAPDAAFGPASPRGERVGLAEQRSAFEQAKAAAASNMPS